MTEKCNFVYLTLVLPKTNPVTYANAMKIGTPSGQKRNITSAAIVWKKAYITC